MRLSPLLISAAIGSFYSLPLANAYGVDGTYIFRSFDYIRSYTNRPWNRCNHSANAPSSLCSSHHMRYP